MNSLGASELAPGAVVGDDFKIVRPLRVGGMGAVYVATQLSTGTPRALKVMQRDLVGDGDLRLRFAQEARVGAQIESDHVVQVVGAGIDATMQLPWIAMELLKGVPLDVYLARRGARPPGEVRFLFEQLCHALGAAHDRGIVHRDLKPANVFLSTPRVVGLSYVVKVLDFGIAKVLAESRTTKTAAVGTPLYMAPEQYEAGTVSPATDVWALGLIAFELLTGRSYWNAARDGNATPASIMYETCLGDLSTPSARCVDLGVTNALPDGFDAWFSRCVQRKPDLRFLDARTAFESLAAVLGPSLAPSDPLPIEPREASATPATVGMTDPKPHGVSGTESMPRGTEVAAIPTHPSIPGAMAKPTPAVMPVAAEVAPRTAPFAARARSAGELPPAPSRTRTVAFVSIAAVTVIGLAVFAGSRLRPGSSSSQPSSSPRVSAVASETPRPKLDPTQFTSAADVAVDGRLMHKKIGAVGATETYLMLDLHGVDAPPKGVTPVHLALLIDRSGSMKGSRLANALSAARLAVGRLRDGDTVSVVVFDETAQTLVGPTILSPTTRSNVSDALKTVALGGNTCISCGLSMALGNLAASSPDAARRILLLSDGEANTGIKDIPGFERIARDAAKSDVNITTIGLGDDYDPKSLTALSHESNGQHYYAATDGALPPILEAQANAFTSVVATAAEVAVKLAPGVRLVSVLDRSNNVDSFGGGTTVHVPLGQLVRNEHKTILIKLAVDPNGAKAPSVADVELTFRAAGATTTTLVDGSLGEIVAASGETIALDPIVEDRVQRSETAAALLEADTLFMQGKTAEAKTVLKAQSNALAAQNKKWTETGAPPPPAPVMKDVDKQKAAVDEAASSYEEAEKQAAPTGGKPSTMAPAKSASKKANADAYDNAY